MICCHNKADREGGGTIGVGDQRYAAVGLSEATAAGSLSKYGMGPERGAAEAAELVSESSSCSLPPFW